MRLALIAKSNFKLQPLTLFQPAVRHVTQKARKLTSVAGFANLATKVEHLARKFDSVAFVCARHTKDTARKALRALRAPQHNPVLGCWMRNLSVLVGTGSRTNQTLCLFD